MSDPRLYAGVDPGANGAIVILDRAGKIVDAGRTVRDVVPDEAMLPPDALRRFARWADVSAVAVEKPIAFAGSKSDRHPATSSMMAVALSAGGWLGRIAERSPNARLYLVAPRTWQSALLGKIPKGETKARSEMLARGLWGFDARMLDARGAIHDGCADAGCLAEFIRQKAIREGW